jgi:cbb3-type cytochrome oxidase maturation protein
MSVLFLLIPLSVIVAGCFLAAFIWAVRSGQYEDTCTPSMRILLDDAVPSNGDGDEANPARFPATRVERENGASKGCAPSENAKSISKQTTSDKP